MPLSDGYSHGNKYSGVEGVYVGPSGAEVLVANASGVLYDQGVRLIPSGETPVSVTSGILAVKGAFKEVVFNTADLATGVSIASVPAGSVIIDVGFRSTVAWDSVTSAAVSVGHGASLNEYVSAQDVKDTVGIETRVAGAMPTAKTSAIQDIKIKVAVVGTTTAGAGIGWVYYI